MTREAEVHAAEDKKRREAVETKNHLDTTIYQLEKTLKEAGDKIPAELKAKFEAAIAGGKKDLESNDTDRMKAALESLSKLGAELYQQVQAAAGAAGAGAGTADAATGGGAAKKTGPKKANVVDADVEIVDDEKK